MSNFEAEAAERYPFEHVGYSAPAPKDCSCDECFRTELKQFAYIEGRGVAQFTDYELNTLSWALDLGKRKGFDSMRYRDGTSVDLYKLDAKLNDMIKGDDE